MTSKWNNPNKIENNQTNETNNENTDNNPSKKHTNRGKCVNTIIVGLKHIHYL